MAKIADLFVEIGAKTDKLRQGLTQSQNQVSDFQRGVNRLGGVIAGAFAVSKVINFAKEVSALAGEAQGVENAFRRVGSAELLEELRQATRGTVSDVELMRKTVQASNFGLPVEKLGKLFEFASRRAQETGESVDYLVQSIVLGIGRKSPLILDNLGISAVRLREELKGVGTEAASTMDIAAVVAKIAEDEMAKMGDTITTSKDEAEKLAAKFTNIKRILGERLNEGFLDDARKIINQILTGAENELSNTKTLIERQFGSMSASAQSSLKGIGKTELTEKINEKLKETTEYLQEWIEYEDALINKRGILGKAFDKLPGKSSYQKRTEDIQVEIGALMLLVEQYEDYLKDIDSTYNKINNISTATTTQAGIIETLNKQLEEYGKQLETATSKEQIGQINDITKSLEAQIDALKNFSAAPEVDFKVDLPKIEQADVLDENITIEPLIEELEKIKPILFETKTALRDIGEELLDVGADSQGLEEFAQNAVKSSKKIIAAYLAEGVAASVKGALTNVPFPFNLVAAGVAGGAAAALFNSLIPSFANEGQVDRPTLAMVGDYPGAASNPEFMLKKSTLKELASGGRTEVFGTLRGHDIYFSSKNYSDHLNRVT